MALCVFFFAQALFAQGTADIVGTVTDNSGAVVPKAKVTVKNLGTNQVRIAETDDSGQYAANLLPVGDYSVTVEAQGFKTFTATRLTIATGDRARVDSALQVGEISQTVEVSEQTVAVQTDSSTVGGLVTSRAVQDLPVNGRNFIRLVQLAPGANESVQSSLGGGTRPDDRRQTSTVSANGQTDSANNFLLDGMDNNERAIATIIVKPSIDAQQEVKVETNMYTAESGRAGGAVINVITKSGTNNFHGTLFEFLRNDKLDAKDVFNVPQAGNPLAGKMPPFRQNQYGGSIGGPIKKDQTFFFVDYEGFRRIKGNTFVATIPTACQLGRISCNGVQQVGNFSDVPGTQIYDPVTRLPFTNNIISPARLNSVGLNYAAMYPTLTGCTPNCNFISSPVQTQYAHTGDVRIDHRFGNNDNFYARYSINNTDTASPGFLPPVTVAGVTIPAPSSLNTQNFPGSAYQRQQSFALSHVHIFSPTLLLQLGAQVARYVTISESANSGINGNTAFGGPGNINTNVPGTSGLALIQFQNGGYAALGDGFALPTAYWDTNYQYTGAMTWTKGSHTIKFGSSVLDRNWSTFQILFKGNFNINSAQTSSAATNGVGGNSFASLLTGNYNQATRNMSLAAPQYKSWELGEYIQDNWRVNSKLTVNLGLRYDIFTPITEKNNALSNFDPTDPATLASGRIQVAGATGVSKSVNIATQYGNIQPRIGFAYSIGRGTVLRGGFGTSYWPNNVASPANLKNAPMVATYTINTPGSLSAAVPLPVANSVCLVAACGATTTSPGYAGGFSINAGTQLPYHNTTVYMSNLLLEKEFAGNVLGIGFVAEPVRNLGRVIPNIATNVPNLAPGGCGAITGGVNLTTNTRCLPFFSALPLVSTIQLLKTDGISNYTALQITFQRRYSKGLSIASNYTWAKALSDAGGPGGACGGCGTVTNDAGRDYGPSDFMVKHRFTFTANYELPFGKSLKGVVGQLVKGWQMNGIYAYGTGQPYSVLDGGCAQNSFGVATCRPNAVPESSFTQSNEQWFDITQYRRQPLGTAGNLGRNTLTMPRNVRLDFSIFKDFRITEGTKLQFRAEGFNITNTPLFGIPGATIGGFNAAGVPTNAGNFGRITSTNAFYTPRDIQLALKLIF